MKNHQLINAASIHRRNFIKQATLLTSSAFFMPSILQTMTKSKYYGLDAKEFKKVLEDNNLTTSSGHYDFFLYLDKSVDSLMKYVDQCIVGAHALNQKYITWPWLDPQSRTIEKFKLVAERLN